MTITTWEDVFSDPDPRELMRQQMRREVRRHREAYGMGVTNNIYGASRPVTEYRRMYEQMNRHLEEQLEEADIDADEIVQELEQDTEDDEEDDEPTGLWGQIRDFIWHD